jgi:prophage antirepressor-like protein
VENTSYFVALRDAINDVMVDCIFGDNDAWFTRTQIGKVLEYNDPQNAILVIHRRHRERLDKFSRGCQFVTTSGIQEGYVYNIRGVFEICRWSKQPKADMVMDALYEMAEKVIKDGYYSAISDKDLFALLGKKLKSDSKVYKRVLAPALADSDLDMRDVFLDYAFAVGFGDFPFHQSSRMSQFENERRHNRELIRTWEEKPYKNNFTYDDIPDWAKEKMKTKGMGPSYDRFPDTFDYLKRHDTSKTWDKNFCTYQGRRRFNREGYRKIIDYALKNHMIYPDEAERWKKEAGLYERSGADV